ncbi:hypothetical protein FB451DRAFT_1184376 [Mycena latifolia]|nr:hypothetical protein FB451DRAFT_1184376 [Mycena latifolia]
MTTRTPKAAPPPFKMRYYDTPCHACGKLYLRQSLTDGSPLCQWCTRNTITPPALTLAQSTPTPHFAIDTRAQFDQEAAILKTTIDAQLAVLIAGWAAAAQSDADEILRRHATALEETFAAAYAHFQNDYVDV